MLLKDKNYGRIKGCVWAYSQKQLETHYKENSIHPTVILIIVVDSKESGYMTTEDILGEYLSADINFNMKKEMGLRDF